MDHSVVGDPTTVDSAGLDSAADFIKLSTGFAAGSLVFSVGLINSTSGLSVAARIFLFLAWVILFAAMGTGVMASSRIPIKKAKKEYGLEDKFLTTPTRVHVFAFGAGIVCLGIVLFLTLFNEPPADTQQVASAAKALALAERCVPKGIFVRRLSVLETIKPIDAARPSLTTWHVQFEMMRLASARSAGRTASSPPSPAYLDVLIDARTGVVASLGPSPCPDAADVYKGR